MTTRAATEVMLDRNTTVEPSGLRLALATASTTASVTTRSGLSQRSKPAATRQRRQTLHGVALAAGDLASVTIALVALFAAFGRVTPAAALGFAPMVLVLNRLARLSARSDLRLGESTLDDLPDLLKLTGLSTLAIAIVTPVLDHGSLSGPGIGALWATSFAAIVGGRLVVSAVARAFSPLERCLIIGAPDQVARISERVNMGWTRATVVAAVPVSSADRSTLADLGSEAAMSELVRQLDADRIILAPDDLRPTEVVDLVRAAKAASVRVSLLPRVLDFLGPRVAFEEVNGLALMGVPAFELSPVSRLLKRGLDLVLATIGVILISPLLLLIAIAIRLDSAGPVVFRQIRVGRDGKLFTIIKFRSMIDGADAQKEKLRDLCEASDELFKITNDPRVTRVGRFLRRSSLDELPQIFNVLRGDMSLVGPRPLILEEDATITGCDRARLSMAPGMTGPWQVLPMRLPKRDMIEIDYRYADNWSLWLDVKILVRTVQHVVRRGNQ